MRTEAVAETVFNHTENKITGVNWFKLFLYDPGLYFGYVWPRIKDLIRGKQTAAERLAEHYAESLKNDDEALSNTSKKIKETIVAVEQRIKQLKIELKEQEQQMERYQSEGGAEIAKVTDRREKIKRVIAELLEFRSALIKING